MEGQPAGVADGLDGMRKRSSKKDSRLSSWKNRAPLPVTGKAAGGTVTFGFARVMLKIEKPFRYPSGNTK